MSKFKALNKEQTLSAISAEATALGKGKYKHNQEITNPVTESVLEATSTVVKREIAIANDKASISVPHLGTFKPSFKPGGMKERRNPQTGATFMKETPDRHKITFKAEKKVNEAFNDARLKVYKK